MRLDNFISDLGIVKRRTMAKEMAEGGHIKINNQRAKPAHKVKIGDLIEISGKAQIVLKVKRIPEGKSISREQRTEYFDIISKSAGTDLDF
jgi:ribosomal 50S subunit-recycling heat shock protein